MAKSWRFICSLLIGFLLAGALLTTISYFAPILQSFNNKDWVEQKLTFYLNQPVHIGDLATSWQGLEPTVEIKNLVIKDQSGKTNLQIKKLKIGVNLFASFLKGKMIPGNLSVEGTHLYLKELGDGILDINNIPALQAQLYVDNSEKLHYLINCFLTSGIKKLKEVEITWYDRAGNIVLPISQLSLDEESHLFSRHLKGKATAWTTAPVSFQGDIYGNFLSHELLYTKMDFKIEKINFKNSQFIKRFSEDFQLNAGDTTLNAQLKFDPKKTLTLKGQIEANELSLTTKSHPEPYRINHVVSHFQWTKQTDSWSFALTQLQLRLMNDLLPTHQVRYERVNKGYQLLEFDSLPIQNATKFLIDNQLISSASVQALKEIQPRGQILNFKMRQERDKKNVSFKGNLKNLEIAPWKKYPGINHLSGNFDVTPNYSWFNLDSRNNVFEYKNLFRNKLIIKKVKGQVIWYKDALQNWQINIKNLALTTKEGHAAGFMNITLPHDEDNPFIQSKFNFSVSDASQIAKYYPVGVMPPKVVEWLDQAIKGGIVSNGLFILSGNTKDFPFDREQGKFLIAADLKNGILHYKDKWPTIDNIKAGLHFEGRSMAITSQHATTLGAKIHYVEAKIPNLDKAILAIKGNLSTLSTQKIRLTETNNPLLNFLSDQRFSNITLKGKMQLGLKLLLPLDKDLTNKTEYQGEVQFNKALIKASNYLKLSHVTGAMKFYDDSVETQRLTGNLFNKPFELTATRNKNNQSTLTTMDFSSALDVADLKKFVEAKILDELEGGTHFHTNLKLIVPNIGKPLLNIDFKTNLQGITSNLPTPFTKQAKDSMPSHFQLEDGLYKVLTFNFGQVMNGVISYKENKNKFELERGSVELDNHKAELPTGYGLKIEGRLPNFDWTKWKTLLQKNTMHSLSNSDLKNLPSYVQSINLKFDQLRFGTISLSNAKVQALSKTDLIKVLINSNIVQGELQIPKIYPIAPIKANLNTLNLTGVNSDGTNLTPSDIPHLDLNIANFKYKEKSLSNIELKLRPQGQNLLIKQASIREPTINLSASGIWRMVNHKHETKLQGNFRSNNLGAMLNQWQITDNMVKGNGEAYFNLTWFSSPFNLEAKSLDGAIDLRFNKGRVTNLSGKANFGMGMGRVLTLFSLQTLQRRLMLDFSDLTEPGFSFDELSGKLQFNKGNIFTKDASMDGPVAKIRIDGRIGLDRKDYNLDLIINPYITSSLPVVATLTAGPIVGAATWLADKVLSHQVKKMTEIHYNVTGTWDKPSFKNLSSPPQ